MDNIQDITGSIKRKISRLLFFIIALFLLSFAVLFLWNAILPKITRLGRINYWQALGLLALCRLLFGGFYLDGFWRRQHWGGPPHLKDKLMNMTDTDRAAFKEEWRKRGEHRRG